MRVLVGLVCALGLASAATPDVWAPTPDVWAPTPDMWAPVSEAVENQVCRNHSQFYLSGLSHMSLWALHMLDASSKVPSGLLMGNLVDLGNYDECLDVRDVAATTGHFSGQHCIVTGFTAVFQAMPLKWAVCIPSTCTPLDLQHHLQSMIPKMLITISNTTCNSREHTTPLGAADWFAIVVLVVFTVLVILSTTYDLATTKKESRRPLLVSFSVYTNGSKLLTSAAGADTLSAVHGVRFLSMAYVVLCHAYLAFTVYAPPTNVVTIGSYLSDWKHTFLVNGTVSVDSFFLLSGLLVCYVFLKEMDKGAKFNLPMYYIHRYIRLTPALAAMVLLTATLFNYLGEGPLWDTNYSVEKRFCVDNWWVTLLYFNNYYLQETMCLSQSWYLSVDMQLFWLSPLIIYPLWRWPRVGKAISAVMMFAGLLTAFLVSYINEFPVNNFLGPITNFLNAQYYPTYTRFTPWLIGIGLGYILHVSKKSPPRLTPVIVAVGWLASATLLLTSLLWFHRFQHPDLPYHRFGQSFFNCYMRPAWALGLAWVIFACCTGYGGFVNTFLSWRFFQVLSRLTYTVYLTHVTVMMLVASLSRTAQYVSDTTLLLQFISSLVVSFAAAFVLSLFFESPAIAIERALLGKRSPEKKKSEGADKETPGGDEPNALERVESTPAKEQDASVGLKDLEGGVLAQHNLDT